MEVKRSCGAYGVSQRCVCGSVRALVVDGQLDVLRKGSPPIMNVAARETRGSKAKPQRQSCALFFAHLPACAPARSAPILRAGETSGPAYMHHQRRSVGGPDII